MLQALERRGLLQYVDYLSTVSGGGFIGSWYLSCLKEKLNDGQHKAAIDHLRKYSRYLAPESGFFSADNWTIAMVWLRNTLLLQATLISLFAVLLLLPRYFEWGFLHSPPAFTTTAAGIFFWWSVVQGLRRLRRVNRAEAGANKANPADGQASVQFVIVLPLLAAAACFCSALWNPKRPAALIEWASISVAAATWLTAMFSLIPDTRSKRWWILGVTAVGALCGGLFYGLASGWALQARHASGPWLAGQIGAPAVMISLGLAVVLQVGLLGRAIDDSRREWWSRLGAFMGIYSLAALALGVTTVYGPLWVAMLQKWIAASLSVGAITTTIGGLLAASSRDTGGNGKASSKELLAAIAPYVFIAGLLLLVSTGVHFLLANLQIHDVLMPACRHTTC